MRPGKEREKGKPHGGTTPLRKKFENPNRDASRRCICTISSARSMLLTFTGATRRVPRGGNTWESMMERADVNPHSPPREGGPLSIIHVALRLLRAAYANRRWQH